VNLMNDPNNCSACNVVCTDGGVPTACVNGVCQ
jgi:hypothetical protein